VAIPDVVVNVLDGALPRTFPTNTGTAFFVGIAERGDVVQARPVASIAAFGTEYGARQANAALYDALDTYFAEGGSQAYVSRVIGAGAVAATRNLLDAGAGVSLVVTAADPGVWGNSLSVGVAAVTGGFQIFVQRSGVEVDRSYTLVTQQDAVNWGRLSTYVSVALGATALVPAAAGAAALTGGTDGSAIVDADWQAALDRIALDLGPGQVCAPGRTTAAGQLQIIDHAQRNKRFALLDAPDSASDTTIVAAAQALYTAPNNGRRWCQMFAPWDVIPGVTANSTRTVAPCARAAAQYARIDALGNPNQAAAGRNGIARYVLDLSQAAWSDTQRGNLNGAGVTVSRRRFGALIETFGMRTLADQALDANWSMAPNVRTVMAYVARARVVGDAHEFDQVDGQGRTISAFRGELMALANDLFLAGALYGGTPAEAFFVETGPAVNSPATIAAGELHAQVAMRTSPSAERIIIDVVKIPVTQSI
jgi:phage tail sheath protein FI